MSPKYSKHRVKGLVVYFTDSCLVEAFHAHASESQRKAGSAKFFIYEDGSSRVDKVGALSKPQIKAVQDFIKDNHMEMFEQWKSEGGKPEYFGSVPKMTLE